MAPSKITAPPGLQADCMGKAPDELDKSEAALAGFP